MRSSPRSAVIPQQKSLVRPYKDLREWISLVNEIGELKVVALRAADHPLNMLGNGSLCPGENEIWRAEAQRQRRPDATARQKAVADETRGAEG